MKLKTYYILAIVVWLVALSSQLVYADQKLTRPNQFACWTATQVAEITSHIRHGHTGMAKNYIADKRCWILKPNIEVDEVYRSWIGLSRCVYKGQLEFWTYTEALY